MWYAHSRGAKISLFAFYPEAGTLMERKNQSQFTSIGECK